MSAARAATPRSHAWRGTTPGAKRRDDPRKPRSRLAYAIGARLVSSIGDGLVLVAFPLLATTLTRSPVLIAGVVFATTLPWLLFGLPAGAIVDRVSRRKVIVAVETGRMGVLLLLAAAMWSGHIVLVEVYAAAFLLTSMETLFDAASMAVIPQLASDGDLLQANSRFQIADLTGREFVGPALGGLAFAAAASIPVVADGASFAVSGVLLALALRPAVRIGRHGRRRRDDGFELREPTAQARQAPFHRMIREGLVWLAHEPRLRLVLSLIASFAFCQGLGLGIMVVYCTRVLHLTGTAFGIFVAVAASGNTIGAWAAPRVHRWWGTGRTLLIAGVVGGAAFVVVGMTSSTAVAVVAFAAEAVAVGVGTVASVTLRQQLIPLEMAGRASAAMRSGIIGSAAIATLVGGAMAAVLGAHAPFAIGGVAQIVAALLIGSALARRLAADDREVIDLTDTIDLTGAEAAAEIA